MTLNELPALRDVANMTFKWLLEDRILKVLLSICNILSNYIYLKGSRKVEKVILGVPGQKLWEPMH